MKKILPIFLLIVCLLGGCGSSSSNYSGEIRSAPDASSLSFYCSHTKDNGAAGGCFGTSYYCVMSGGKTVIYEVSSDTTANNGYTVKYVIEDMPFFDDIASDIKDEDWKALFLQCQKLCKFTGDGEVVSEGMNDLDSRYENGRYKWEDEYESLMFNTVVDSGQKNDFKRVVEYDNEYDNATVTLTHDGDKYYIEYVAVADDPEYADSFNSGPYGGEIDKSYYTRIMYILDYIEADREKFNAKAVKYSQFNIAHPNDTLLMNFAMSYLALSVDEKYKDNSENSRYEADSYLSDIERIIAHEDSSSEDYYIFKDIPSGGSDGDDSLHDYYAENDYDLQIVDYDKYVDMWNYYTFKSPLVYDDDSKDYAVRAILGFSSWVSLWVEHYDITDGVLNISMCFDKNGVMASGDGVFLVIPVPKGTKLGTVDDHIPEYKLDPNYEVTDDLAL